MPVNQQVLHNNDNIEINEHTMNNNNPIGPIGLANTTLIRAYNLNSIRPIILANKTLIRLYNSIRNKIICYQIATECNALIIPQVILSRKNIKYQLQSHEINEHVMDNNLMIPIILSNNTLIRFYDSTGGNNEITNKIIYPVTIPIGTDFYINENIFKCDEPISCFANSLILPANTPYFHKGDMISSPQDNEFLIIYD